MTDAVDDERSILVRTSCVSPRAWDAVVRGFTTPSPDGFLPDVAFLNESHHAGMSPAEVLASLPHRLRAVVFIADDVTEASPESLVLAVRPGTKPLQSFRLPPAEAWGVENNLSLANMDWHEFMEATRDGVFRGF